MATSDLTATSPFHALVPAFPGPGGASMDPRCALAGVTREKLAFILVQALGLQAAAKAHTGDVTVSCEGTSYTLTDQGCIAPAYRGYVHYALKLGLLSARYTLMQGSLDQMPEISASFGPSGKVTRAEYASAATRYLGTFLASAWLHGDAPREV